MGQRGGGGSSAFEEAATAGVNVKATCIRQKNPHRQIISRLREASACSSGLKLIRRAGYCRMA